MNVHVCLYMRVHVRMSRGVYSFASTTDATAVATVTVGITKGTIEHHWHQTRGQSDTTGV